MPVIADIDEAPHVMLIARSEAGEQPMKLIAALESVVREVVATRTREMAVRVALRASRRRVIG